MKKLLLPLVFSIVLLIFNPNLVYANLDTDEIEVRFADSVRDETIPITVPDTASFIFAGFQVDVMVNADGQVWVTYTLTRTNILFFLQPSEIWLNDLDWVGQQGQVVDFFVTEDQTNINPEVSDTPDSVHITIPPIGFSEFTSRQVHFQIEAEHDFVGGEFIGVDSTALLVSGAQMNASWMIPVIVSAIGIGIVIARKF